MDIRHPISSDVQVIRACYNDDAMDLLAVASGDSVEVFQVTSRSMTSLAFFILGLKTTAIAWSPRAVSPGSTDDWFIELVVSTIDFGLHILSKTPSGDESAFRFGGGLTGHHARINDLTFVGGQDHMSARHIASVSDDGNLIVWDLRPHTKPDDDREADGVSPTRPAAFMNQPTALVIAFAHPLCSVCSHPSTSKELVVSDSRGSVFLIDWTKDPVDFDGELSERETLIELVHPRAIAEVTSNTFISLIGSTDWRRDNINIIGSVLGTEFALWDIGNLRGGKPFITGPTFPEGGHRFRWCPSLPEYFAISTAHAATKGAVINISNIYHLKSQPASITIAPRPHRVTDFDWLATRGTPRLVAAVGRDIYIFPISLD